LLSFVKAFFKKSQFVIKKNFIHDKHLIMRIFDMDYKIASGDNLWNIAKNNYNCQSNKEIQEYVNLIAKENNIQDPNKIYADNVISLPENDAFIKESSIFDSFDDWTSSEDNYEKAVNGEDVDGFQMFDLDLNTYSTDLKDFAQGYLDKFDEDGDGVWNKDEFITMSTSGLEDIPEEYQESYSELFDQLFNDLNINDKDDTIDAKEFASYLFTADLDYDKYSQTDGDVASSIDGNLDYTNYQALSSLEPDTEDHNTFMDLKESFYNNFYAE
jgi:hypothetical protein